MVNKVIIVPAKHEQYQHCHYEFASTVNLTEPALL